MKEREREREREREKEIENLPRENNEWRTRPKEL